MADTNLPGITQDTRPGMGGFSAPVAPSDLNAAGSLKAPNTAAPAAPTPSAGGSEGMNADSFTGLLGSIGQKLKYNNELAGNRQLLLKHLYDSPLTSDEITKLPKDIRDLVATGNKDAMELQVRVLNDQLQGRANTLGQTVQALTTGYTQSVANTKNAMTQILAYAQSTGRPISEVAKALGPIFGVTVTADLMKNLQALGAPLLKTTQVPVSGAEYGSATSTVSSALGVLPTTPLSSVIEQNGIDPIVDAIIKNEGSSPAGVQNNPGNIKYYDGLQGATRSGVKASDGGEFASFATPEEGRHAIEFIVQNAADSASQAYGTNPTLGSFIDMYTNTAPDRSVSPLAPDPKTGNIPESKYGGRTPNDIYDDALNMLFTGKSVQSYVGGLSNSGAVSAIKNAISNTKSAIARSLGGNSASFQALYTANKSAAKQNVERVARVESIAEAMTLNVPRLQELTNKVRAAGMNITESDLQAGQAAVLRKFGSADAAAYIELIQTIRSDYAATQAALAGSRGGQFFAEAANDAVPVGLSAEQYGAIKDTIVLSSENAKKAINNEVQSLLGVSGSIDTGGNNGGDDYVNFLKLTGNK